MRIGLVLDHFDPARGGVEQWTYQLASRLVTVGHEVHVIAGGFGTDLTRSGFVQHRFQASRSRMARAQAAADILRRLSLDVVHDMGVGWHCDVFQPHGGSRRASFEQNLLMAPRWHRPVKRFVARQLPRYREFKALTDRQYENDGRIVLALSEMVRADLRRWHGVADEQIRLIYNGVDTDRFTPAPQSPMRAELRNWLGIEDEVLFLIVAHNLRLKGVPTLIKAVALLAESDHSVRLAVVGGKRTGSFQRLARRLGVTAQVHFVGPVDDTAPFYAAADAYVQPTFYDPCSLVVLEALASGLPVITTRFNGAGELMTPCEHGFLLDDPSDAQTLAGQMLKLLDSRRRRRMSLAARQLALLHSFTSNVDQVLAVYHEVIASKSGQRPASFAA